MPPLRNPLRLDGRLQQAAPRRVFLKQSLAAAASLSATAGISAQLAAAAEAQANSDAPAFKVVDSHQHLWDLKKFRLPWTAASPALARDYTRRDYLAPTAGIPIAKSIYLEVDVEPSQQQA